MPVDVPAEGLQADPATTQPQIAADRALTAMDGYPHTWPGGLPTPATATPSSHPPQAGPFGAALAELGLTIRHHGRDTADDGAALAVITEAAVALIVGTEHAAVVVPQGSGRLVALAAHGDLPPRIMDAQNQLGVGPCLDAATRTDQLIVDDLVADRRWPAFTEEIRPYGVRSMLCTPLALPGEILGSLTLASTRPDAFDAESIELAAVFAAHATLAVSNLRIARHLDRKATSRDIIGQAKGILMERHRLTAQEAFASLAKVSQNHNIKLQALCEYLAATGDIPA